MRYEITTPPQSDALDLQAVKDHMRLTHSDDDAALLRLINAATGYFEKLFAVALIDQQVTVHLNSWPNGVKSPWWDGVHNGAAADLLGAAAMVNLPVRPLRQIDSVALLDDAGNETLWDPSNYRVTGGLEPRLVKKDGVNWPTLMTSIEGIRIVYTAGFGATSADVPLLISHGLMEMITHLYTYRGDDLESSAQRSGAHSLWSPYRRVRL